MGWLLGGLALVAALVAGTRRRGLVGPVLLASLGFVLIASAAAYNGNRFNSAIRVVVGAPVVVDMDAADPPSARVDVGSCLGLYRIVGPLWFAVGHDDYPGDTWDDSPKEFCELSVNLGGVVSLPTKVTNGGYGICSWRSCFELHPANS